MDHLDESLGHIFNQMQGRHGHLSAEKRHPAGAATSQPELACAGCRLGLALDAVKQPRRFRSGASPEPDFQSKVLLPRINTGGLEGSNTESTGQCKYLHGTSCATQESEEYSLGNTATFNGGHQTFQYWKASMGQLRQPQPHRVTLPAACTAGLSTDIPSAQASNQQPALRSTQARNGSHAHPAHVPPYNRAGHHERGQDPLPQPAAQFSQVQAEATLSESRRGYAVQEQQSYSIQQLTSANDSDGINSHADGMSVGVSELDIAEELANKNWGHFYARNRGSSDASESENIFGPGSASGSDDLSGPRAAVSSSEKMETASRHSNWTTHSHMLEVAAQQPVQGNLVAGDGDELFGNGHSVYSLGRIPPNAESARDMSVASTCPNPVLVYSEEAMRPLQTTSNGRPLLSPQRAIRSLCSPSAPQRTSNPAVNLVDAMSFHSCDTAAMYLCHPAHTTPKPLKRAPINWAMTESRGQGPSRSRNSYKDICCTPPATSLKKSEVRATRAPGWRIAGTMLEAYDLGKLVHISHLHRAAAPATVSPLDSLRNGIGSPPRDVDVTDPLGSKDDTQGRPMSPQRSAQASDIQKHIVHLEHRDALLAQRPQPLLERTPRALLGSNSGHTPEMPPWTLATSSKAPSTERASTLMPTSSYLDVGPELAFEGTNVSFQLQQGISYQCGSGVEGGTLMSHAGNHANHDLPRPKSGVLGTSPNPGISQSRSRFLDAGNCFRSKPEMHAAMTQAQLHNIMNQHYLQAMEDCRHLKSSVSLDLATVPSPARTEARRHLESSVHGQMAGMGNSASHGVGLSKTVARAPHEVLVHLLLTGRVSEEVLVSTLQRQSRDIQDATVKLIVNFTARCAPQSRCQVSTMCAIADMTAFSNALVTSKLEVAEEMLNDFPETYDEANLVACSLASRWGRKASSTFDMYPDVEDVLLPVYHCLSKVDLRLQVQQLKLAEMRERRGNAAGLHQASLRMVVGGIGGLAELEHQVAPILTDMLSCSKILVLAYVAAGKEVLIRGEKEGMVPSAMTDAILRKQSIASDSPQHDQLTDYDFRRIEKFYPGTKVSTLLAVPVLHKKSKERSRCVGLVVAINKRKHIPVSATSGQPADTKPSPTFNTEDISQLRRAAVLLAPAIISAAAITRSSLLSKESMESIDQAQKILDFSETVFQSLEPDDIWRNLNDSVPRILGCKRVLLYVYVERGILAVHNPEHDVLEFLTIQESGLAGTMFGQAQSATFWSSHRHLAHPQMHQTEEGLQPSNQDADGKVAGSAKFTGEKPSLEPNTRSSYASQRRSEHMEPQAKTHTAVQSHDTYNAKVMPQLSTHIDNMMLVPLRTRMTKSEARQFTSHLDKDDDSDDSDLEMGNDLSDTEATWGVMLCINKEMTLEQLEEAELQQRVRTIRNPKMGLKSNQSSGSLKDPPRAEFGPAEERVLKILGRIVHPAVTHSRLRGVLQDHLHSFA